MDLIDRARAALQRSDWAEADHLLQAALAEAQAEKNPIVAAVIHGYRAQVAAGRSDWAGSEQEAREALALFESAGDPEGAAAIQGGLADLCARRGAWDEAEGFSRAAESFYAAAQELPNLAAVRLRLGQILLMSGRRELGCAMLRATHSMLLALDAFEEAFQAEAMMLGTCGPMVAGPDTADRSIDYPTLTEMINATAALLRNPALDSSGARAGYAALAAQAFQEGDWDLASFARALVRLLEAGFEHFAGLEPYVPIAYRGVWQALGVRVRPGATT